MKDEEMSAKLEKLIREKYEKKEFDFKDSYWKQYEAQKSAQKRRVIFRWIIPMLAIGIVSFAVYYYLLPSPQVQQDEQALNTTGGAGEDTENIYNTGMATMDQPRLLAFAGDSQKGNELPSIEEKPVVNNKPAHKIEAGPVIDNKTPHPIKPAQTDMPAPEIKVGSGETSIQLQHNFVARKKKKDIEPLPLPETKAAPVEVAEPAHVDLENPEEIIHNGNMTSIEARPLQLFKLPPFPGDTFWKKTESHPALPVKSPGYITVDAGANYFVAGKGAPGNIGMGAGIRYMYPLGTRFSIGSGIMFTMMRYKLPTLSTVSHRYGFGYTTEEQKMQTVSLDYIEIPIELAICFNTRHYISAGMSYNYLLSAGTSITTELQGEVLKMEKAKVFGRPTYINAYDFVFNAGYRYYINNNFSVFAGMHYGLTDISNNALFKNTDVNRNMGIKLMLSYKLSK